MAMRMYNSHRKRRGECYSCCWAHLDGEILEYIFKCLVSIVDVYCAKAVCFWWKEVAESVIASRILSSELPWLMFPPPKNISGRVLNLEERRFYGKGIIGMDDNGICFGLSHGRSIYINGICDAFLFNPFTSNRIQLPRDGSPLDVSPYLVSSAGPERTFCKATLSSDPSKGDYFVILILNERTNLALYKSGDVSWKKIDGKKSYYCDIMCHNKQLYAVGRIGSLEIWDLAPDFLPMKKLDIKLPRENLISRRDPSKTLYYLVESAGQLLLALRYIGMKMSRSYCKMVRFNVFELDLEQKLWVETESLGDRTLFLGANDSISISSKEKFPRDCIYFTVSKYYVENQEFHEGHYYGIFNLKSKNARVIAWDGVTETLDAGKIMKQVPIWVVPPHPWNDLHLSSLHQMATRMYNPPRKRNGRRICSSHGWAHLHRDILEYIFKCLLSIVDVYHAKTVCFWWNTVAESVIASRVMSCDVPWLMIPPLENTSGLLLNIEEKRFYGRGFTGLGDNAICFGSSHGWLIYINRNVDAFLFNPFTRNRIQIPRICNGVSQSIVSLTGPAHAFCKATLSSDPGKGEYFVILMLNKGFNLALYKSGDLSWKSIYSKQYCYLDIMCRNKQLYAVGFGGSIEVWDLVPDCRLVKKLDLKLPKKILISNSHPLEMLFYLVESAGQFLLACRYIVNESQPHLRMVSFSVFEMDLEQKLWVEVESLGDRALFLGAKDSMSIIRSKETFPGDCIYFTDKDWYKENTMSDVEHHYGIFSLKSKSARFVAEDGVTGALYKDKVVKQAPVWVVPPHSW